MEEYSVNQRIKFLIENELKTNVHRFSKLLGVSDGTVRNYVDNKTKPGAEFLAHMIQKVPGLQAHWLLTGEGEPINSSGAYSSNQTNITAHKNKGNIQGASGGNNTVINGPLEDCRRDLTASQKEVEHLRAQLAAAEALVASKDVTIASKEETISVLRAAFNRPN